VITKTERSELRSVVRQQFKVLRSEINQREAELKAEARQILNDKETENDKKRANVDFLVREIVLKANREINDVLYEQGFEIKGNTERAWVSPPIGMWGSSYQGQGTDKQRLERQTAADIEAKVKTALTTIDRQEADLLRELAVGALESEEAQAFLAAIPTVSQLVPNTRLAELEAQLDGKS
jgi:hypothetical protein